MVRERLVALVQCLERCEAAPKVARDAAAGCAGGAEYTVSDVLLGFGAGVILWEIGGES